MSTKITPHSTFQYQGKLLRFDGLTDDRRGIKSAGRIFWMFPVMDSLPLPPVGPVAILPVTINPPDLTAQHPQVVRAAYEKRRRYYERITREEHLKHYPADSWVTAKFFEKARKRILRQPLEKFSTSDRAREAVWDKCRTKKLAAAIGLLDAVEQSRLILWFKAAGLSTADAQEAMARAKYVAIYNDPAKTRCYLYDVIEQPDAKAAELELARRQAEERTEILKRKSAESSDLSCALQDLKAENTKGHKLTQAQVEVLQKAVKKMQRGVEAKNATENKQKIIFAKGFHEIIHPMETLVIPRARYRARAMELLYNLWKTCPGKWADWKLMGKEAGYDDPSIGFFRNVEDRNRPEVLRVIKSIADEERTQKGGKAFKVRLKPEFRYEKQS